MTSIKPCPFCGTIPTLICDLTDWAGIPIYKANENGYRSINYHLKAKHKRGCFIYHLNGTNSEGKYLLIAGNGCLKYGTNGKERNRMKVVFNLHAVVEVQDAELFPPKDEVEKQLVKWFGSEGMKTRILYITNYEVQGEGAKQE